jgi:hypothetical protein
MRARLLLMVLMIGCGGDDPEAEAKQVCGGEGAMDGAVYEALTATSWLEPVGCRSTDRLPPTCNEVRLSGDGTYAWQAFTDVLERDQKGTWNFRARDATGGVVCLDDGSVVDFELAAGGLRWGRLGVLVPDEDLARGPGRDALPAIAVDPLFLDLTANGWAKTNEMELYLYPASFALRRDGTFDAAFRGGACTVAGTFGLVGEPTRAGRRLVLESTAAVNACDIRFGDLPFAFGGEPRLEDGVLHALSSTYRDAAEVTERRYLELSAYSGATGLTVFATWDGALRAGTPTSWAFELRNDDDQPQQVSALRIELTPEAMTANGFMSTGPAVRVIDRPLDLTIAPGDRVAVEGAAAFTPGPAGWTLFDVQVDSSDGSQAYRNRETFLTELP